MSVLNTTAGGRLGFRASLSRKRARPPRRAFSLIEVLIATVLTLMLMSILVVIFGQVGDSVRDNRSMIRTSEQLRALQKTLQSDLANITVTPLPPRSAADGDGFLEIHEGPIGPVPGVGTGAFIDPAGLGSTVPDGTVGDVDDEVFFTVRSKGNPYVGRHSTKRDVLAGEVPDGNDGNDFKWEPLSITSRQAEVAWFLRGTTLYRRVLLIQEGIFPDFDIRSIAAAAGHQAIDLDDLTFGWYGFSDVSVHQVGGPLERSPSVVPETLVANSLADLARREYRYGHQPYAFPYEARFWGVLGMPTLRETTTGTWPLPLVRTAVPAGSARVQSILYDNNPAAEPDDTLAQIIVPADTVSPAAALGLAANQRIALTTSGRPNDAWRSPLEFAEIDITTGALRSYVAGNRVNEDVIMTNVLSFDVKVYDPGARVIARNTDGAIFEPGDPGYVAAVNGLGTDYTTQMFGAYVDLNYLNFRADTTGDGRPDYPFQAGAPEPKFQHAGNLGSRLSGADALTGQGDGTYDTWTTHYETDGYDNDGDGIIDEGSDGIIDQRSDGLDNDGINGVDDLGEQKQEAPPPYDAALRAIQIRIRVFEPDSRKVREITVRQEFIPE